MNTNLKDFTKYTDFHHKMCEENKRRTVYNIEVTRDNNKTALTVDPKIGKYIGLENEVYITSFKDKNYALITNLALCDDSVRLAFDNGTTTSTDEEGILRFLNDAGVDTTVLNDYTFKNVERGSTYAILPFIKECL